MALREPGERRRGAGSRRLLDLAVTLVLLPPALLIGALIAIGVAIDSPGPVLFRSRRVGRGGRTFAMVKFRTMRHLASGPSLTARGDDRQTPFGRFLALTRLDELPQLWNVAKGDMRLVGPRPELPEFVAAQRESYKRILEVPPGLTGPTQLAFVDEGALLAATIDRERLYRDEILPAKVRQDLAYVESSTLRGDLRLIALTCIVPLLGAGQAWERATRGGRRALAGAAGAVAATMMLALFVAEAGGAPW